MEQVEVEDIPNASPKNHSHSTNQSSVEALPFQNIAKVTYSSPKLPFE
jgi:hypothetical protein